MNALTTICGRELSAMFRIPLGWIVIALFACLSAMVFVRQTLIPGEPATMREFFRIWWGLMLFLCPAISMRLFSEEFRSGTAETTMTAPVGDAAVVAGKFFAGLAFLVLMLAPTLVFVGVLASLARPDYGPILSGYLGLILLGMLYVAIGTLASACTGSQTLAFLGTLFTLLLLDLLPSRLAPLLPDQWAAMVYAASPSERARPFYAGLIDSAHIVYFLAVSTLTLTLATIVIQWRRWR
ncbi:MAG: hypothetical protein K2W85_03500 [Phycisphaerales bacterium]|nr:hypothetical protein [Phycisphaerales bacterium]